MINEIEIQSLTGLEQYIVITAEDGSTTSMLKSTYEAQQAEQSTPIVVDEAETI
jgi:hypothetical protein